MSREIIGFAQQHYPGFVPDCDSTCFYARHHDLHPIDLLLLKLLNVDLRNVVTVTAYKWPAQIVNGKVAVSDQAAICLLVNDERIALVKLVKCVKLIERLQPSPDAHNIISWAKSEYPGFVPDLDAVLNVIPCTCDLIPRAEIEKVKANPNVVECSAVLTTRWPVCAVGDDIVISKQVAACLVVKDKRMPVNLVKCFDFWS